MKNIIHKIDLTKNFVAERYKQKYKIDSIDFDYATAIEIRNIPEKDVSEIDKVFLENKIPNKLIEHNKTFSQLIFLPRNYNLNDQSKFNAPILKEIYNALQSEMNYEKDILNISGKLYTENFPLIMGIVNVTPDSFSDGGKFFKIENAIEHAIKLIDEGADIIDVGGESTRPGADFIDADEEIKRVIPVIEGILKANPEAVISIDTTKSEVAREAMKSGVKIINDISGLTFDEKIAEVASEFSSTLILMHTKGDPKTMQKDPYYDDVVSEIYDYLLNQIEVANSYGVQNIIVDPGIGFGKRVNDNYEILNRLTEFKTLGKNILVGLSRKSFLSKSIDHKYFDREISTAVAETIAVLNGAKIIRTHNVINAVHYKYFINRLNNPQ